MTFPFPGLAWALIRSILLCLSNVALIAMMEVIADNGGDALPVVARLAVGKVLVSSLVDAPPVELLLDAIDEGSLDDSLELEGLGDSLELARCCRVLGVVKRSFGNQPSSNVPIPPQYSASDSSLSISMSNGTPAGFL